MSSVGSVILLVGIILFFNGLGSAKPSSNDRTFQQKCSEYQSICKTKPSSFNFGEVEAAPKEFPHMVSIGHFSLAVNKVVWHCGGTLISDHFILTAASCVPDKIEVKYVRLGDLDHETDQDDAQTETYNITERIIHPLYNYTDLHYDIALIRIENQIEFNEFIQPACLSDADPIISDEALTLGWGITKNHGNFHSHLQKIQLNLVSRDDCQKFFSEKKDVISHKEILLDESQICAKSIISGRDTCAGFGGGPLLNMHHKFSCLYETIGIMSFGATCGSGHPGVYTHIGTYIDWIESVVWTATNQNSIGVDQI